MTAKPRILRSSDWAGVGLLVLLTLVLYFPSWDSFWLFDDPALLKQIVQHGPWENFFVPEVWRLLSAGNFTPWVLLSLDMDWRLFGLQPFGFYLHHVASLCLLLGAAYGVLRRWFSGPVCLMGLSLFLLSPPLAESARLLMERHYIEGLLFALASIHFFVESEKRGSLFHGLLGAGLYLIAAASKEIYVPLPFLLPLLVRSPWRRRAVYTLPWMAVLLLCLSWRSYMLGRLTGGYGLDLAWPADYLLFPGRVVAGMGGGVTSVIWWKWLVAVSTLLTVALVAITPGARLAPVLAAAVMFVAPLIPVSPIMAPRYVWLLFFGWLVVHMMAWDRLKKNAGRISAGVIWVWFGILAAGLICIGPHGRLRDASIRQQAAEGRFVLLQGNGGDLLVNPASSGWYYSDLSWLRENVLRLPAGPGATADSGIMCFDRTAGKDSGLPADLHSAVWQFDPGRGILVRRDMEGYATEKCVGPLRAEAPLSLRLTSLDSTVLWQFGPYQDGQYSLFLGRSSESLFVLPRTGSRSVSFRGQRIYCRVKYVSPEGWWTYSPLLKFDVGGDDRGDLSWERRARKAASPGKQGC